MFATGKNLPYHSYRALKRTELSNQKGRTVSVNTHSITQTKRFHTQLKRQLFGVQMEAEKNGSSLPIEMKQIPRQIKIKSKSIRNIFKNAHSATKDESFLMIKKQQPYTFACHLKKNRRTQSQKWMPQQQINENSFDGPKETIERDEDDKKYKTLTYQGRKNKYRRKYSLKKETNSPLLSPVSKEEDKQSYFPLKIKKESVKGCLSISSNLNQHIFLEKEESTQQQTIKNFKTIEKKKQPIKRTMFQHFQIEVPLGKENKTIEEHQLSNPVNTVSSVAKDKKKQFYSIPSHVTGQDITQRQIQEVSPVCLHDKIQKQSSQYKEGLFKQKVDHQEVLKTIEKDFSNSNPKQQKASKKIKSCKKIQEYPIQTNLDHVQEVAVFKEKQKERNDKQKQLSLEHQVPILKEQLTNGKTKNEVSSLMNRLSNLKERLELLGQLATFFSQKSKLFKFNKITEQFYRNKENLKWHKLTYLCFKYFISILVFCSQFYKKAASILPIKQSELQRFQNENELLKATLQKIRKSVLKNSVIETQEPQWLTTQLPSFSEVDFQSLLNQLEGGKAGTSTQYIYMTHLYDSILEESAIFIKSFCISKILNEENATSIALKEAIFRVLNICSLLHLHRNASNTTPPTNLETITDISLLNNPQTSLFRSFYNNVIQTVFIK